MKCLRHNRWTPTVLLGAVLLAAQSHSQTTTPSDLKIEGDPTLTLDPACNACKGAPLKLRVRNDSAQDVPISFSHGTIASDPKDKPFPADIAVTPLDAQGKPDSTRTTIKAHDSIDVQFQVTGVLGEAVWTVPLLNQGKQVVDIKVKNPKPDFTVKLDSSAPDNPELTFERGKPGTLTLRNDADTGYSVAVSYTVNSRTVNLSLADNAAQCEQGSLSGDPCIVKIPAHSPVQLKVVPEEKWFDLTPAPASWWKFWTWFSHPVQWAAWGLSRVGALLKDQTAEGRLQVQMASSMCARDRGAPILSYKITTHLAAFSKNAESLGGTLIIAGVLLLGGTLSLIVNFFLPMQERRRRLKTKLQQAGRKITDLSLELDSRVRVPVGVERQRLQQRIKDLSPLSPQYGPEVTDVEQSLDRLMKRLDVMEQMQRSLSGYWRHRQHDLPASVVRQVENSRKQAVDLLQKSDPSDADLQKILGLLQEIDNQQTTVGQANVAFAKQLIDELTRRRNERTAAPGTGPLVYNWFAVPGYPAGFFGGFNGLFIALGQELDSAPQNVDQTLPENYPALDALRVRLNLLDRFRKLLPLHPAPSDGFVHATQRLLTELQSSAWDSLMRAERAIREMEEGVFPEDIVAHVEQDRVRIKIDRLYVRQFEPAELSLEFGNRMLRNSAAREEFTYRWNFDHDNLTEDGWSVSHYFPYVTVREIIGLIRSLKRTVARWWWRLLKGIQTGDFGPLPDEVRAPYNVRASLILNSDGTPVAREITLRDGPLSVHPQLPVTGHALVAELFRLVLALGFAVLGLVAGAKDQILKLDVVPALIAVFLLGFGADQIKNLLTQQGSGK